MPAIKIGSGATVHLKNVGISGFEIGVEGEPGASVTGENVNFHDVSMPWNMPGAGPSKLSGTRITDGPHTSARTARMGWHKQNGPPLPVFCPNCKSITPSSRYNFGGAYFQSWNNEEPCKICNFPRAKLSEGVFDLTKEAVKILSAPDITYTMLQALSVILAGVKAGTISSDQAVAEASQIAPAFNDLLLRVARDPALQTIIAFLALLVAIWAFVKAPTQPPASPPVHFSQQQALEVTLSHLQPVLGKDAIIDPQAASERQQGPQPAQQKSVLERGSIKFLKEKKPHSRDLRRLEKAAHRKAFGGSRSSPPKKICD